MHRAADPITYSASTMDLKNQRMSIPAIKHFMLQSVNHLMWKGKQIPILRTANDDQVYRHGYQKGSSQACKEASEDLNKHDRA